MNVHNKLECLYLAGLFSSLMFASKVGAYLSEAPFRVSTQGYAPGLNHKY